MTSEESWPFEEVNAFYMLVYIMEDIGWRELIRPGLPGLKLMLEAIKKYMHKDYPKIVQHLEAELGLDVDELMTFLFTDNIVSVFISKLKDICPLHLL